MNRRELVKIVKELNTTMGLDPPIATDDSIETEEMRTLLEEAVSLFEEGDAESLSEEAHAGLVELELLEEEEEEEDEEEEEEEEEEDDMKGKAKAKKKKKPEVKEKKPEVKEKKSKGKGKKKPETKPEPKAKKKPEVKEKKEKKGNKATKFGHRIGTMSGTIDEMLIAGTTKKAILNVLEEEYGREPKKAKAKLMVHLKHLKVEKGVKINKENGNLSAK